MIEATPPCSGTLLRRGLCMQPLVPPRLPTLRSAPAIRTHTTSLKYWTRRIIFPIILGSFASFTKKFLN